MNFLFSSALILILLAAAHTTVEAAVNQVFTVNSLQDAHDANPNDEICADASGRCTLRAAIEEANRTPDADTINFSLPLPATIDLTLGQLNVDWNLDIVGPGARQLTVRRSPAAGTGDFGIFYLNGSQPLTAANLSGLTIANGTGVFGGAVYVGANDYASLIEVTVKNNTGFAGGGIFNAGNLGINRSTVSGNSVSDPNNADGGAIYSQGRLSVVNSTISGNNGANGGAIFNSGALTLDNSTISNNAATRDGGGVFAADSGSAYARNTILAGNSAGRFGPNTAGVFTTLGNNLIGDGTGGSGFVHGIQNDIVGNSTAPVDARLGPLQNNGGPTDTRFPAAGSPAVNAGSNCVLTGCSSLDRLIQLKFEQRRLNSRAAEGVVDIGAVETNSVPDVASRQLNLRVVDSTNNNRPLAGAPVSFTTPTGEVRYGFTNPFGYFKMKDLISGEIYIIQIKGKRAGSGVLTLYLDYAAAPQLEAAGGFELRTVDPSPK
ncbi:MAG: CSLREA domain-containing protein [Acidobacteria bacterium]|nr:CSLREA domain-containing protein [Acidobacteriota bacterium]